MKLTHLVATAALTASLLGAGTVAADAATSHHTDGVYGSHNVLRSFCTAHRHTSCVSEADDDTGRFAVRDSHGRTHHLHTGAQTLRYVEKHSHPCAEEDSTHCYWDAANVGDGIGDSFVTIGNHHYLDGTTGTVWYLDNED